MDVPQKCPRGHDLEEDAVLCTVCWMRVVPEDPEVVAARRRRRRRIWIPFMATTAVLAGVVVGGALARTTPSSAPAIAADGPTTVDRASVAPAPVTSASVTPVASTATTSAPSDQAMAVGIQPQAATIADPGAAAAAACTVTVLDQTVDCTAGPDVLAFRVCVPETTSAVGVRMRESRGAPWRDVPADVTLGDGSTCASGLTAADVSVGGVTAPAGDIWRLVGRDSAGAKLWASRLVASEG